MAKRQKSTFERLQPGKWSRRERRQWQQRLESEDPGLTTVHPDAAGIDVGNQSHFVSVPPDRDECPVQEFGSWTADLQRMAAWLKSCGIRTVAMQSTGVYWIAVQEVLEGAGLEVFLVKARGPKNLPGRKSDVQECQWLRKLHTYGLLRNSFRPPEQVRTVRTLWRLRERWVQEAGRAVQQMQKALTKMNVQLANAIRDLSGKTGMAMVRAILDGERDPWQLAKLRQRNITASEAEIASSLEGNWRADVLFELRQVVEAYDFDRQQMSQCDVQLQQAMAAVPDRVPEPAKQTAELSPRRQKRPRGNQPKFDLRSELQRSLGVDLTVIEGIDVTTAQVFFSEVGPDLSAFPSEDHFASWLELSPRRDVSGGRVIRHVSPDGRNRLSNALRMAAQSLSRSDSYLGARYRSLRGRLGGQRAVKAMARYLAVLLYRLLTKGQAYVDRGAAYFEAKRLDRERVSLERRAAAHGLKLIPQNS